MRGLWVILVLVLLVVPTQARLPEGDYAYSDEIKKGDIFIWKIKDFIFDNRTLVEQQTSSWRLEVLQDLETVDPQTLDTGTVFEANFTSPDQLGSFFDFDINLNFRPLIAPAVYNNSLFFNHFIGVSPVQDLYLMDADILTVTRALDASSNGNTLSLVRETNSTYHKRTGVLVNFFLREGEGFTSELDAIPVIQEIQLIAGPPDLMFELTNFRPRETPVGVYAMGFVAIFSFIVWSIKRKFGNPYGLRR